MPTGVSWVETLTTMQADGPILTTNGVLTSMLNAQAKAVIKPNSLYIGKRFRIAASGQLTTLSAITNHTISVLMGATTVFTSPFQNVATAATNSMLDMAIVLDCRNVGNAANFRGQGTLYSRTANATGVMVSMLASTVGGNFDNTIQQSLDIQMSIVTTGITSIQLFQYSIESMN